MKNKKLNLRAALEQSGAKLDDAQIAFVSAFENALEERSKIEEEEFSESMQEALRSAIGQVEKDENGNVVTIADQIRSMAENLEKMQLQQRRSLTANEKFQLRKMIEDNHAEIIEAIRGGKEIEFEFQAKRAADKYTTTTSVANDTGVNLPLVENFEIESGVATIRYPDNFILNVIPNRQVAKVPQQIIRVEQATAEGAATLVAEGGIKPLVSDTFLRTMTPRKKYAGRIEWTEEFEIDNEMLFNEILLMFEEKVVRAWQDGILTTIITNALPYTTSALDDTLVAPNNALAVIAAQSVIAGARFTPDTAIMNPADIVSTMFMQNAQGEALVLPYVGNGQVNGLTVIASTKIPVGKALILDSSIYRELHSAFILRFGTYADQFIKNEKTAIGEVFSILRIAKMDLPGAMYIDLATVKAALLKP